MYNSLAYFQSHLCSEKKSFFAVAVLKQTDHTPDSRFLFVYSTYMYL